jgi:hypothetical protein
LRPSLEPIIVPSIFDGSVKEVKGDHHILMILPQEPDFTGETLYLLVPVVVVVVVPLVWP